MGRRGMERIENWYESACQTGIRPTSRPLIIYVYINLLIFWNITQCPRCHSIHKLDYFWIKIKTERGRESVHQSRMLEGERCKEGWIFAALVTLKLLCARTSNYLSLTNKSTILQNSLFSPFLFGKHTFCFLSSYFSKQTYIFSLFLSLALSYFAYLHYEITATHVYLATRSEFLSYFCK